MRARLLALALLALTPLALQALQAPQAPNSFDVLIRNGRILDGTGNPWYRADIGITAIAFAPWARSAMPRPGR
jgi:hypothetical protein